MSNTTDTFWSIDGISLQTLAFNIVTWAEDREAPPPLRGSNVAIAYKPGQKYYRKTPDSRTMTLGMWVQGTLEDGSTPPVGHSMRETFEKNWKALRRLLWRPRQQFLLSKQFRLYGDPTIYSGQALAEFVGGLNMTMNGEMNGVFTVDLLLADPFFYGPPVTLSFPPGNPEQTLQILGDDRTMKIMADFQGQTSHIRINNETDGVYMDYTKPLATGQYAHIDVENFSAKHDVNLANSNSTFSVVSNGTDPFWFFLEPGTKTISVAELNAPAQSVTWTNKATNPSFESTSGTATVATNLYTNPRLYSADPSGTLAIWRTNLVSNAGFEGTTVPTNVVLGATVSRVTTQHHTGTAAISVATTGTSGSGVSFTYSASAIKNLVWGSAWVLATAGFAFSVYFLDSLGARGTQTYVGTGSWQRVTTLPAAFTPGVTVLPQMYIVQSTTGSAGTFYVDDVMVTADGVIDEEFTGATATVGNGFTYAWTGTANASTSVKKTTLSEIARNLAPNPQFANDITANSASQTTIYTNLWQNPTNVTTAAQPTQVRTNLVSNPRGGTNTTGWSALNVSNALTLSVSGTGGPASSDAGHPPASYISATRATYTPNSTVTVTYANIAVTAGQIYACSLWARTSSALLVTEGCCSLQVSYLSSGGSVIGFGELDFSVQSPSTWDRVSVVSTAPAGAVNARISLTFNRFLLVALEDAATFDFTGVMFETADHVWPYFDGSYTTATPFTYAWTGTANASTSTETSTRMITRVNFSSSPDMAFAPDLVNGISVSNLNTFSQVSGLTTPIGVTTAIRSTATASGTGFNAPVRVRDVSFGETYTTSIYIYSQMDLNVVAKSAFYSSANSLVATSGAYSGTQHVPANTWTRVSLTYTVPAGRAYAVISFTDATVSVPLSSYAQVTGLLNEGVAGIDSYFGPSTSASADLAYFTVGNGNSVLGWSYQYAAAASTASVPAGATGNSLATWGRGSVFRSTLKGATGGTASLAIVANGSDDANSYAALSTTGMTSGHTYAVLARCTIGTLYGSPTASALQITSAVSNTILAGVGTVAGRVYTFKAVFTWDGSYLRAYNGYQGGTVYWDEICLVDVTDTNHVYPFDQPFYGTTSGTLPVAMQADPNYADFKDGFAWTGTANASTSTFKALKPFVVPTENNALAITSRVGRFSQNGISQTTTCLRIEPTSLTSNASYVSPGGDSGALRLSLAPSGTYYISASVANTPQSGTLHDYAKRMVLTYKVGSGAYVDVPDSIDPLDNAHHYIVATLPVGTTEAFVRLYNGAYEGNGSVYWGMFGVLQIDPSVALTELPYMVGGDDAAPMGEDFASMAWTGTQWNSASIMVRPLPWKAAKTTTLFSPAPVLRYNGDLSYRGLTIDDNVTYNGQPVSVTSGVTMAVSTTYLIKGHVVLPGDTEAPFTTDNSISVVWSTGVLTPTVISAVPTTAGEYDYIAMVTTPATGTLSSFLIYFSQSAAGTSYWNRLMVVAGANSSMPSLNGTTQEYNSDPASSWTGTANQSTSILSGAGVASVTAGPNAVGISSSTHTTNRAKSLQVAATGASTDSYVSPGGDSGSMRLSLVAGHLYTFSVQVSMGTPQTGSVGPYARQMVVWYVAGGQTYSVAGASAPNVSGGTVDSRVTIQFPANTTQAWVRFYNGSTLGDSFVWFDSFLVVESIAGLDSSKVVYFDGSTANTDIATYAWTGTADASTSTVSGIGTTQPIVITYQPAWI